MARLTINYNSYYQRPYRIKEWFTADPVELLVGTQFFEPRVRFKKNESAVRIWEVERDVLSRLGFSAVTLYGGYASPTQKKIYIFIPEMLRETFSCIEKALSATPHRRHIRTATAPGFLTSSGRSIWTANPFQKNAPVCIKIDTIDIPDVSDFLDNRRLNPEHVALAALVTRHLTESGEANFFREDRGVYIRADETTYRYVVLERTPDFARSDIRKGDYLIPMQCFVAPLFWANSGNRRTFGLETRTAAGYFAGPLAAEFAALIRNSIERTFTHFEIHQQNLTCHLRDGELKHILVHDLQDTVFDPISYLLSLPRTEWAAGLAKIAEWHSVAFFNFYGEPRSGPPKHTHYFTPDSFYRRYFRNFGNYTRLYNHFADEDYLFSKKFEWLVAEQLAYTDEHLGITENLRRHPNYEALRKNLFWIISRRVEVRQMQGMANLWEEVRHAPGLGLEPVTDLLARMRTETCFFSGNGPGRREDLHRFSVRHAYELLTDRVYLLIMENEDPAIVLFTGRYIEKGGGVLR